MKIYHSTTQHPWLAGSGVTALLLISAVIWLALGPGSAQSLALQNVTEKLSEVTSGTWKTRQGVSNADGELTADSMDEHYIWSEEYGTVAERYARGKLAAVDYRPGKGKASIEVIHQSRSVRSEPGFKGSTGNSFEAWLMKLAQYRGEADRKLDVLILGSIHAQGFEVALNKIEPEILFPGNLRVWFDPETELPVRMEMRMDYLGLESLMVAEDFEWNVDLPAERFTPVIPEDYEDITQKLSTSMPDQEKAIIAAFEGYHNTFGKYPDRTKIAADEIEYEVLKHRGVDYSKAPKEPEALMAFMMEIETAKEWTEGFRFVFRLQRDESRDLKYHGRTVKPGEANRVLLSWKLSDGNYRVLSGDLKLETITAAQLKQREATPER